MNQHNQNTATGVDHPSQHHDTLTAIADGIAPTREDKSKEDCSGNGASGYAPTMRFSTISAAGPLSAGTCRQRNN